jgi:hypothetical protein
MAEFAKSAKPLLQAKSEARTERIVLPRLMDKIPDELCPTLTPLRGDGIGGEGED